ncbi:MAG: FtsH protease activity modulator HflK [Paenibacillaceae bacterium]
MSVFDEQRPKSTPPELPPGLIRKIIIGVIILVVILFGFSMFYTVEEGQRGAIMTFGKFTDETESGLHFKMPYPIQQVKILDANITQRMHIGYREANGGTTAVPEESMMITGDENIVSADAVVEWKIANIEKYLFNIDQPEVFLRNAAIASIRTVMGSNKLDYAITEGKTKIQGDVRAKLVELMAKYDTGITIIDLKFQDIEPPEGEVQQAFRDVTNAREEKNTKINNANKYKNDRLPKARGEAQALLEQAEAQKKSRILNATGDVAQFNAIYNEYVKNPSVTERRLILETLEKVLPNAQIFITDSAGDTVKYLPINEMLKPSTKAPVIEAPTTQAPATGGAAQ